MRWLLGCCSLALLAVLFFPLWRIDLMAPQYPEGLMLLIYPNKLGGNVDIINGLNHYIGMRTLHAEDFIEFKILPYIVIFFSGLCVLTAIVASKRWLNVLFILFVCFGVLAMYDFWRWEYDYGHNLSPDAAIIVPGMAYQPPLIGFKQLLNFGAYSFPDVGGWLFIAVGIVLLFCIVYLWRKSVQLKKTTAVAMLLIGFSTLTACNQIPKPIKAGVDHCDFCKMTISETKFAAEILNKNGKAFLFDDIKCMLTYLSILDAIERKSYKIYFVDYLNNNHFIDASEAHLLESASLKTPMAGNIIALTTIADVTDLLKTFPGNRKTWNDIIPK